jgi:hypothetical protein
MWLNLLLTVHIFCFGWLAIANPVPRRQIQQRDVTSSPPFYPSPWMDPNADGWADAYAKAKAFVSQLTLMEKVNLTTGVG